MRRIAIAMCWSLMCWTLMSLQSEFVAADSITVVNSGFEDTTGQSTFNEFTFGTPVGWDLYDPDGVIPNTGVFTGTLLPNGTDFFDDVAPEGERVAIFFNSAQQGAGEYGIQQTLTDTLLANTQYTLTVEVGNIASGIATNGTFFNLDEFPGYRIDLLAGTEVVAQDLNGLSIAEAEFETSTLTFTAGANHSQLGEALGIRLVNLNEIPSGFTQATSPDLEVDFDLVQLSAVAVPEPGSMALCSMVALVLILGPSRRGRRGGRGRPLACRTHEG